MVQIREEMRGLCCSSAPGEELRGNCGLRAKGLLPRPGKRGGKPHVPPVAAGPATLASGAKHSRACGRGMEARAELWQPEIDGSG